jgi:hypothetical protein
MLIQKITLVDGIRDNLMTSIPPTIVPIRKEKCVTIVERKDILSMSEGTRRNKRKMIIKFLMMKIW